MSDETTDRRTADPAAPAPTEPEPAAVAVADPVRDEAPADDEPVAALPPHDEAAPYEPALESEQGENPKHEPEPASAVADEPAAEAEPATGAVVADRVEAEPVAEADEPTPEEVAEESAAAAEVVEEADAEPVAEADEAAVKDGEPVPAAEAPPSAPESNKKWYVVKVQSNREESIKAAIERQVKIQGLEEFFGQIVIPVEEYFEKKKVSVKDKKTGQKVTEERNVTKNRKKYPGYLFAEVEFNDRILYVFRETSGVGDFVGATHHRAPNPMPDREVQQMLTGVIEKGGDPKRKVKVKLDFEKGDKVRVRDGSFAGAEAEVKAITEPKDPTDAPKVTVVVSFWGRPVEMELDAFQVDKV